MLQQDRTGTKYERLLAASLLQLGYALNGSLRKNYLHPAPAGEPLIPGTYIQPDLVVREREEIRAILYSTHWNNMRDSKRKFWRTWEEACQQKLALGKELLTVNCVFEALPAQSDPGLYANAADLPVDNTRSRRPPIPLNGWDPGIGWALVEAFDVSLIFPVGYRAAHDAPNFGVDEHDAQTTALLAEALEKPTKSHFYTQWRLLGRVREHAQDAARSLRDTRSRYRIGLLHLYLFQRLFGRIAGERAPRVGEIVDALADTGQEVFKLDALARESAFRALEWREVYSIFDLLSRVYVRSGRNAQAFCALDTFSLPNGSASIHRVRLNEDLRVCLKDIRDNLNDEEFVAAVERAFSRFDQAYGVEEALDDLADLSSVELKEHFVRDRFASALSDANNLNDLLQTHAKSLSADRTSVSDHRQNWVLEMLLYLAGLNSAEDIPTRFREIFERSGHRIRSHAPFGDHGKVVAYLLQGRDICEQWSGPGRQRTLTEDQFRQLSWQAVAETVAETFQNRGSRISSVEEVIARYLQNKSMRIISADLNGFHIMIEHYLGDLCYFLFAGDNHQLSGNRVLSSWQTDLVRELWGGRPLQTWVEGMARNEDWLIKVQSAQDGNEGHKTKELAGRCRGTILEWAHGEDPRTRSAWTFGRRSTKKLALVLDGDWSAKRKKNLYEAGWDWVGDVAELGELRELIGA